MQDYPSYTRLNSYDLEALSQYEPMPGIRPWQLGSKTAVNTLDIYDEIPNSVMDCLMTMGLVMFLLFSSSVLLGYTADRLTQGMLMLMEFKSQPEIVTR